jgi:hypothetical protein
MPVLSASVVTKSALKRFEFSHRPPPLRLRENDELDVPRFFTCGEWCENLANDWIGYTVLERPMSIERIDAFWVPITGEVDPILIVELHDSPWIVRKP